MCKIAFDSDASQVHIDCMETAKATTGETKMSRKENLEAALAQVVGAPVEITVRGERDFTFSTDRIDQDFEFHLVKFFGAAMTLQSVDIDDECGTFVYMRAA